MGIGGDRGQTGAGHGGLRRDRAGDRGSLLSSGARVWICDIDAHALAATKDAYPNLGGSRTDVAQEAAVDAMFAAIEQAFGGLNVLINNAGIAGPHEPNRRAGSCRLATLRRGQSR